MSAEGMFQRPLHWTTNFHHSNGSLALLDFVESHRWPNPEPERSALAGWWRAHGSPEERAAVLKQYPQLEDRHPVAIPAGALKSGYVLTMQDISTYADRAHWVARGRIQLHRRADQALVADYVGLFASQQLDVLMYGSWWEDVTPCPGEEAAFLRDGRRFDATGFFFRHVGVPVPPGGQR